jgi:hypothetical protein
MLPMIRYFRYVEPEVPQERTTARYEKRRKVRPPCVNRRCRQPMAAQRRHCLCSPGSKSRVDALSGV